MQQFGKFLGATSAAALAVVALSGAARADDAPKLGYSLTLTALSDYMFRGISLTNEKPQFNPYLEFTYGIGYLGFWATNIGDSANPDWATLGPVEVDYYLGIRPVTGPLNWDIAAYLYTYGSRIAGVSLSDVSYVEFKAGFTTSPVTNLTLGLTGYWTPEQRNNFDAVAGTGTTATPDTWTIEGTAAYTLPSFKVGTVDWTPTLSGLLGYTSSSGYSGGGWFLGEDNYTYWNAGMKITVEKFFMDFRYWDTSIRNNTLGANGFKADDMADSRFLFSAGVTLP